VSELLRYTQISQLVYCSTHKYIMFQFSLCSSPHKFNPSDCFDCRKCLIHFAFRLLFVPGTAVPWVGQTAQNTQTGAALCIATLLNCRDEYSLKSRKWQPQTFHGFRNKTEETWANSNILGGRPRNLHFSLIPYSGIFKTEE